ncbi:MAG: uroporphyrinogen decarboxylase family protein [Syntrophobacter sp.]
MSSKQQMTSRERVFEAISHREPDRVPIVPASREIAIKHSGYTFADIWADGNRYVEAQAKLIEDFNLDAAFDIWCTPAVDEMLGAHIEFPDNDAPWVPEPLLKNKADIGKLKTKMDPQKDGRMPFLLNVVRGLRKRLGPDIPIFAWVSAPFRTACMLRGSSQLYLDILRDPGFVKELLETVIGPLTQYGKALADAGADIICTSNPVANNDCIRYSHYKEFSHPYTKRLFGDIKAHKDVKVMFHTCGNWNDRFDLVTEENVDILHVDKVELEQFKKDWGSKITIMGNVRAVSTMLQGTPEQVEAEAASCITKAAKGGGYFLSADCTVPIGTPTENIRALVNTGVTKGVYSH